MKALIGMERPVNLLKQDGSVDHKAPRVVEYNISNGTDYLVNSGTTGESVTIMRRKGYC